MRPRREKTSKTEPGEVPGFQMTQQEAGGVAGVTSPVAILSTKGTQDGHTYFQSLNRIMVFFKEENSVILSLMAELQGCLSPRTAMATGLCEISFSGETQHRFMRLLLSSGWKSIGFLHSGSHFGLRRVLITPYEVFYSSFVGTFNRYSLPGAR